MPVPPPLLDSRTLQDILAQLRKGAAHDVPEWTPAPEGDAGTMLQRIFARLLELALQRLNQVPEKNLLAFLDTMGVSLLPPAAATVPLTFSSTPGSPPIFVPRGMQAGTLPRGEQPAVIFETEDDFTIIPAQLATSFTMDPRWDRYTDQTAALGGQSPTGFTPFVGTKRMPHVLYLGDNELLHFAKATVELDFLWELAGKSLTDVLAFLKQLTWQYTHNGQLKMLTPSIPDPNRPHLRFLDGESSYLESIDQTLVQGVSEAPDIRQGQQSCWLQAQLTTPLPNDPAAQALKLAQLKLTVDANGLLPDLAFSNAALVDVTQDFFPFGEAPREGDAFYLASREVFAKAEADVTLTFNVRRLQPKLQWEYFDAELHRWQVFTPIDYTTGFTQDGAIVATALNMEQTTVNRVLAFWVRVRLLEGAYNRPPKIRTFTFLPQNESSPRPPQIGFVNQTPIDLGQSFLPFSEKPSLADIFYFGETSDFPPDISIDVTLDPDPPLPADLKWEYLGANGWAAIPDVSDTTAAFMQSGTVTFKMPPAVQREVNGQANYWVRVRIASGDYGRPAEFVPVDPDDPQQGFTRRPGTGNLQPPQIQSQTLAYTAERFPTILTQNGFLYSNQTSAHKTEDGFAPFDSVKALVPHIYADTEPAFYLGFDAAFPEQPVTLYVAVAPRALAGRVRKETQAAVTLSAKLPALQWEYFNGTIWRELAVFDGTNHLTESGTVEFLTPPDIKPLAKFDLTARYWLRARARGDDPQDTQGVENNPQDTQRVLGVFLNTLPAIQAATVQDQTLGSGTGQPAQTLRFTRTPVLPGQQVMVREPESPTDEERLALAAEEGDDAVQERTNATTGATEIWVRWHEVANFIQSDTLSRHYTLDHTTGVLLFGDGKHGLVPPRGTNNIVSTYRMGGGPAGNAPRAAVVQVKSPLPGVAAVTNPIPADGGAVAETIPMVKERGPQTLKHRYRAVTCADLEWLARQAAGTRVARARCLPNVNRDLRFAPGWVTLLIVPQGTAPKLVPSAELIRQVEDYLEAHAFIGLAQQGQARVNVMGPGYLQVTVVAEVVPQDIDEAQRVKQRALTALDAFFHPLTGGPNGTGWEFGRDVYASEVSQVLQGVSGVSHVKFLQLTANVSQVRLTFTSAPSADIALPEGSGVMTVDRQKAALLAEPVAAATAVKRITVKGFQEGERIAKVQDLTVQSVTGTSITVKPFDSDAVGCFPRGSVVMTFDGTQSTRLQQGIPPSRAGETTIEVEERAFASDLESCDVLTVFYPLPMTVTSVTVDQAAGTQTTQTLGIEPYETAVAFPAGSLLAALDNRIRLPLSTEIPANETVTSVTLRAFARDEAITLSRRDEAYEIVNLKIQDVEPVADIVYLDNNFLVYPGAHRITMVSATSPPSRA
jgi:hypothetical protein